MKESFRARLLRRALLLGVLVTQPAPALVEILVEAGFDWLFIDLEHAPLEMREAEELLRAAGERAACVLRVPLNDEIWIKKALDSGAAGVIVPQVNTAEDARRAVRFCKYPPQGTRSVGLARAQGYGARLQEYLEGANAQAAVIVQVEHIEAVQNVNEILSVAGVDALLAGPYDLSASMRLAGQVDSPEVQAALETVRRACQERGTPLGIFAASAARARPFIEQGYCLVAAGADILLLASGARETVKMLRK